MMIRLSQKVNKILKGFIVYKTVHEKLRGFNFHYRIWRKNKICKRYFKIDNLCTFSGTKFFLQLHVIESFSFAYTHLDSRSYRHSIWPIVALNLSLTLLSIRNIHKGISHPRSIHYSIEIIIPIILTQLSKTNDINTRGDVIHLQRYFYTPGKPNWPKFT